MGADKPDDNYTDATQRPGAIVIRPKLDPSFIYDPQTKHVVDRATGDYFVSQPISPIYGIYRAGIRDKTGKQISGYEYRFNDPRLPNGEAKYVYEIFWALRGEDETGKTMRQQIAGREDAKNDSIERLASFLLAQSIGYRGGIGKGETVLVDRRKDDLRGEMR